MKQQNIVYPSHIWVTSIYFSHKSPPHPRGTSMDVTLARCIKAAVDCPGHPLVKVAGAYAGSNREPGARARK